MDITELVALYTGAWSEPDRAVRQQLLERAWADDGTYTDPTTHLAGRQALIDHIGRVIEQFPGARLEVVSEIDLHHEKLRFNWRMLLANGTVFMDGIDFAELSPDGRLLSIVGFFGPLALKS